METIRFQQLARDCVLSTEAPLTVLDLGCGEGRHSHASLWHWPSASVIGIDLSPSDLKTAKDKGQVFFSGLGKDSSPLQYSCADGTQLPLADNSIDIIICSEVLEHIHDYTAVLSEVKRVLKPGGSFAASVPRAWPEKICWALSSAYHQVEGGHLRIFSAAALSNEIQQLGFTQVKRYYAHALHSPYWWLRCLFWRHGDSAWACRQYHRLLVWDLMQKPWLTRTIERLLNPMMGKSVVWHFTKDRTPNAPQ